MKCNTPIVPSRGQFLLRAFISIDFNNNTCNLNKLSVICAFLAFLVVKVKFQNIIPIKLQVQVQIQKSSSITNLHSENPNIRKSRIKKNYTFLPIKFSPNAFKISFFSASICIFSRVSKALNVKSLIAVFVASLAPDELKMVFTDSILFVLSEG